MLVLALGGGAARGAGTGTAVGAAAANANALLLDQNVDRGTALVLVLTLSADSAGARDGIAAAMGGSLECVQTLRAARADVYDVALGKTAREHAAEHA